MLVKEVISQPDIVRLAQLSVQQRRPIIDIMKDATDYADIIANNNINSDKHAARLENFIKNELPEITTEAPETVTQYAVIVDDTIRAGFSVKLTKMTVEEYKAEYGEPYDAQRLAQRMCDALNEYEQCNAYVTLIERAL